MKNVRIPRYEGDTDNPETMTRTSLVTAVEVQASHHGDIKRNWQIPVRLEQRDSLTALVFHAPGVHPVVTVLLTGGDRIALIELLGGHA